MASPFDFEWNASNTAESSRPLWTLGNDIDNPEKMLAWQNAAYDMESRRAAKYRDTARKHIMLFRGKHYADQGSPSINFAEASQNGMGNMQPRVSKLVVNYLYDAVNQRISRVTKNKAAVNIYPANTEYADRTAARVVKYWVDYKFYEDDLDSVFTDAALTAYICGESYVFVWWDPNKGGLSEEWKEAKRLNPDKPRIMLRDDRGQKILGEDGQPLYVEHALRAGDVSFRTLSPLNCLPQYTGNFANSQFFWIEDYWNIDELRAKYKDLASKIEADPEVPGVSEIGVGADRDPSRVLVRSFYQRPSEFMASGRWVISTRKVVLENKPLPVEDMEWPLIRLTDIDIPGEQRGQSFFIHGKAINATINDFTSMMRKNTLMAAHPRWVIPKGSLVKKEALGNDITQIDYQGPIEPRLVGPPPMSQEVNILRRELKEDLMRLFGISDFAQGKVPPNIRSAMALQMVDEQDEQRSNSGISKFNKMVRDVVRVAINQAGVYYEEGDNRLVPIVGRDQRYMLQVVKPQYFRTGFNVRVANSSGLPSSKAAKTETLIELNKGFPGLVRPEQVADMLEFSETERFYDQASVASRAAEAENEQMTNGDDVVEPAPYENHVVHWNIHMREIQNLGFKTILPPPIQAAYIQHVMSTEMLMLMSARKHPQYSLELIQLPQFPAFYQLTHVDRVLLDRARSGNPLSLIEIEQLETYGTIPDNNAAGVTPPPGGTPTGAPPPADPSQAAAPQENPQEQLPQELAAAQGGTPGTPGTPGPE